MDPTNNHCKKEVVTATILKAEDDETGATDDHDCSAASATTDLHTVQYELYSTPSSLYPSPSQLTVGVEVDQQTKEKEEVEPTRGRGQPVQDKEDVVVKSLVDLESATLQKESSKAGDNAAAAAGATPTGNIIDHPNSSSILATIAPLPSLERREGRRPASLPGAHHTVVPNRTPLAQQPVPLVVDEEQPAAATTETNTNTLVQAELAPVDSLYEEVVAERDALRYQMNSMQEASVVVHSKAGDESSARYRRRCFGIMIALLAVLMAIVIVVVVGSSKENNNSPSGDSHHDSGSTPNATTTTNNNTNELDDFWESRKIGQTLYGKDAFDEFGESVSISGDGTLLAVGGEEHGDFRGRVVLFALTTMTTSAASGGEEAEYEEEWYWQPIQEFVGENYGDESARVALSSDGSTLAIAGAVATNQNGLDRAGHVKTYKIVKPESGDDEGWQVQPIGQLLEGTHANERFGIELDLSSDGNIMVVGSPSKSGVLANETGSEHGCAQVHQYDSTADMWIPLGDKLRGDYAQDFFGQFTTLAGNGQIVAVGGKGYDGNNIDRSGIVRVYKLTTTTTTMSNNNHNNNNSQKQQQHWVQMGEDFYGIHDKEEVGRSISLSFDGNILAFGGYRHNNSTGRIYVYRWQQQKEEENEENSIAAGDSGGRWIPMGQPIDGLEEGNRLGRSIAMSDDGSVLAAGAYWSTHVGGDRAGHVRVFQWNNHSSSGNGTTTNSSNGGGGGGSWEEFGPYPIMGANDREWFGRRIALARDGSALAVGGPFHSRTDGIETGETGRVQVYKLPLP